VYFDSRCYDKNLPSDTTYRARSLVNNVDSTARPYFTSTPPAKPLWSQEHMAADTFQIIASGPDGHYGDSQVYFPSDLSGPAAAAHVHHQDNITNFASGPLLDAAEALKK